MALYARAFGHWAARSRSCRKKSLSGEFTHFKFNTIKIYFFKLNIQATFCCVFLHNGASSRGADPTSRRKLQQKRCCCIVAVLRDHNFVRDEQFKGKQLF